MAETSRKTDIPSEFLKQVVNPWLLGADPEFFVIRPPNQQVSNDGAHTCEFRTPHTGAIGWDHNRRVWELRPAPSPSAYGVVTNIWKLLKDERLAPVEKLKWKSGGVLEGDTIGGHIHFGFPVLSNLQIMALDAIIAGLARLEILPSLETRARSVANPGLVGGDKVRTSIGHVEYRAPCSWLDKPGQALAALTICKLATVDPESVIWPTQDKPKAALIEWLTWMANKDVDAFLVNRLINKRNFEAIQADPGSDFCPMWRKEELWSS